MLTVAIVSQKGGSSKTTLAVHLAAAAAGAGFVALVLDTDPQATASAWKGWRGDPDPDVVDCAAHALLGRKLKQAADLGADFAVIDTPPHADIMAREACKLADLVLVPCRPRAFDLDAVSTTAALALASRKPAFVVFTAGPPRGELVYAEAGEIVAGLGLTVAPVRMPERAVLHHAVGAGRVAAEVEPDGKAAADVAELWRWVCKQVGLPARKPASTRTSKRDGKPAGQRANTRARNQANKVT
jgi:chromosome partitioning protein